MRSIHRLLGTLISVFFLMWFVTGLVLLYHSFPNLSNEQKYEKQEAISNIQIDINEVLSRVDEGSDVRDISVRETRGQTLFSLRAKGKTYVICADSTQSVRSTDAKAIAQTVKRWIDVPISRIDTLNERDQWIMYSSYKRKMPIYKYYFDDDDKHQLYISAREGKVLQLTTSSERIWAYVGAIPHKLYFPFLRKYTRAWINSFTVFGIIILIVCIAGMYLGISISYRRYRSTKRLNSPYKNVVYRWHHICGLIFGVFLITWAISGAMSIQRVPQCLVKTQVDYNINSRKIRGERLKVDKYVLDYRALYLSYKDIKEIRWSHYQDTPIYSVVAGDKSYYIDASGEEVKELYLDEKAIDKTIRGIHGDSTRYDISLINEYDNYYLSLGNDLDLPVYKVDVADSDNSVYYINPKTGRYKYLNTNRKVKKWLFSGLHYFKFKFLSDNPCLWTIIIWLLCLGGICVTASGVYMSVSYLRRKSGACRITFK